MIKVIRVAEAGPMINGDGPKKCLRYWNANIKRQPWFDPNKEHLVVLLLSTKFDILGYSLVSIGSLNESLAHPREIFRPAIAAGAYGIVALHNHPSGDPAPSRVDRALMERVETSGELLAIRVLDQIIVGKNGKYYSFVEETAAIERKKARRRRQRQRKKREGSRQKGR